MCRRLPTAGWPRAPRSDVRPGAAPGATASSRAGPPARRVVSFPPTVSLSRNTTMAFTTTASGLQYEDTVVGDGAEAQRGRSVTVHYTDRKSTRLNSSHLVISYAVFCLKKKKIKKYRTTLETNEQIMSSTSIAIV